MRRDLAWLMSRVVVDETTGCWVYQGYCNARGYGRVGGGAGKQCVHRISYEIAHGPIPDGGCACHRCDNPPCVNPAHLFLGSQADNMRDMASKGRHRTRVSVDHVPRGEAHPGAKLTRARASGLRARAASGETVQVLANESGVHPSTVYRALSGARWAA